MAFTIVFGILSLICLVYWVVMVSYASFGTSFAVAWLAVGILFGVIAVLGFLDYRKIIKMATWIKRSIAIFISVCAIFFAIVESMIVAQMFKKPQENLEYVIVLGAQVRGTTITKSLRKRLDAAIDYLEANPDTVAIVSGGKGDGEDLSEAECMYDYMVENGIASDRIIMEDKSTSTDENIRFSMAIIEELYEEQSGENNEAGFDGDEPDIGIITNNFHVYRTVKVCEKKGYEVNGIAADSDNILFANYMVREFFALVQYKITGKI